VTGSTDLHAELEAALAAHVGTEAALVFSSGYLANLGVVAALGGPGALVVSDAANHASIVDACRLSRSRVVVTPHLDVGAVEKVLADRFEQRALVVVDAVFSVDGELAPLAGMAEVCRVHDATLVVDEAHALGVVGARGEGAAALAGLLGSPAVVLTATLSKSLGAQGGAVLGSAEVVAHLVDSARTFVFDTGLAPSSAGAALAALRVLQREPSRAASARARAGELARTARGLGLDVSVPDAAVTSVRVGEPAEALRVAQRCAALGVRVGCFRPPSVPDGRSRIRLTARADLTDADLRRARAALAVATGHAQR
jgi:8-amino-7-oxononanoate synthase